TYGKRYKEVVRRHGKRAPGRNIVERGMTDTKPSTCATINESAEQLKVLLTPPPAPSMRVLAARPSQPPSGVLTRTVEGYAIPSYIVECESGGDPTAVNTSNPD